MIMITIIRQAFQHRIHACNASVCLTCRPISSITKGQYDIIVLMPVRISVARIRITNTETARMSSSSDSDSDKAFQHRLGV